MANKATISSLLIDAEKLVRKDAAGDALKKAEQASELARTDRDFESLAEALRLAVAAKLSSGAYIEARDIAKGGVADATKAGDKVFEAAMTVRVAEVLLAQGDPEGACTQASEALAIYRQVEDKRGQVLALLGLIDAQLAADDDHWRDALRGSGEAVTLAKPLNDTALLAATWLRMTRARLANGAISHSVHSADEALSILRSSGDKSQEAFVLICVAEALLAKGKFDEALRTAKESLALFRAFGPVDGENRAVDMLVKANVKKGATGEAVRIAKREVESSRKPGSKRSPTDTLHRLVKTCLEVEDYDAAELAARDSLLWLKEQGDLKGQANATLALAEALSNREELEEAAAQGDKALLLFQKLGNKKGERETLMLLTDIRLWLGQPPPPSPFRSQALGQLKELGSALNEDNLEEFTSGMHKLKSMKGISQGDIDQLLLPLFQRAPVRAKKYIEVYAEECEVEGGARRVERELGLHIEPEATDEEDAKIEESWKVCPKKFSYFMHRVYGMGFGPSFQTVEFNAWMPVKGNPLTIGVVGVPDEMEEWEDKLETHPGLVDAPVHMQVTPSASMALEGRNA